MLSTINMAHRQGNKRIAAAATLNNYLKQQQTTEKEKNVVWIYTDASYNNQKKIGAVAYTILNHNRKHVMTKCKTLAGKSTSTFLELVAIQKAINSYKQRFSINNVRFIVVSDCLSVVKVLNEKSKFKNSLSKLNVIASELIDSYDIECIHTEGHAKNKNRHSKYNQNVDQMCRKKVREEVVRYTALKNAHDLMIINPTTNQCSAL